MSVLLDINKVNERLYNRTWKCIEWKGRENDNRLVCDICENEYIERKLNMQMKTILT